MLSQLTDLGPILFLAYVLGLVIAITVHEFAHALMADKLGDPTPRAQGRLTLNPLSHLDPLGSLMMILTRFGWGRPVQFDPFNLENPRRDAALISLAGPVSNLLTAAFLSLVIRLSPFAVGAHGTLTVMAILTPIIFLNVTLAIFNLVPIHPLDGGKILIGFLPRNLAYEWDAILSRYGTLILIFLILPIFGSSPITYLILPVINLVLRLFLP